MKDFSPTSFLKEDELSRPVVVCPQSKQLTCAAYWLAKRQHAKVDLSCPSTNP